MPQVDGKQIKDAPNGVSTAKINDGAVQTAKIADAPNGVTEGKINDSAVTTNKINNGAVTEAKLNASVAGNGLTGGAGSPLAVGATAGTSAVTVNADDIAVSIKATGALEIEATGQGELDVKDGGIDTARLANAPNGVTTAKINDGQVTSAKIAANTIVPGDVDLTQTWDFSSGTLQAAAPSNDSDVATKLYVDSVAQGLVVKAPCRIATTGALDPYTPSGSGVGKTITMNSTGVLTIDGVNVLLGDRVLVKNEGASDVDHGIYECTTEGSVGVAAVLTRAEDFDGSPGGEVVAGAFTFIEEGTSNADTGWVLATDNPITVDTTPLAFNQFSGAGAYTWGDGLDNTGNTVFVGEKLGDGAGNEGGAIQANADTVEVLVDDTTIEITDVATQPGNLRVKDDGITEAKLNTSVAGDGIDGGGGTALSVNVGDIAGNGLESDGGSPANLQIKPDTTNAGPSVAVDSNGLRAAVPIIADKEQTGVVTTGNDFNTGIAVAQTPAHPSYVRVSINGVAATVGDGVNTKDCYFADPGAPTTPVAINAIKQNDVLVWNGTNAGYQLATSDVVDFEYAYAA